MPVKIGFDRDPSLGLLPPGVYKFVVEDATEKTSKAGEYINLRIRPYVRGQKWGSSVFEGLYTTPESRWKVQQFLNAVNAPLTGEAGPSWFKGKSGYARFGNRENNVSGVLEATVVAFLTEDEAERQLAKIAEKGGSDDAVVVQVQRNSRPVASTAKAGKKSGEAVAELDDPDSPF